MWQNTANQRITGATKHHVLMSLVHLKLHGILLSLIVAVLLLMGITAFIVVGITRPNVESLWEVTQLKGPFEW